MKTTIRILHLEDDVIDAELVQRALDKAGLVSEIKVVRDGEDYVAAVEAGEVDVVLSDNNVTGFDGVHALQFARGKRPGIPFIFVSGFANEEQAREKLNRSGATACVSKLQLPRLADTIKQALENTELRAARGLSDSYVRSMELLVNVVQDLSLARDLDRIMAIVRRAARDLTGADGATFVLRDGELCHYADEDAIAPLWKGRRFPMTSCISGWAMLNRQAAVIEDIYADPRIPADAYRPTFVKSLVMVPIRTAEPVGAIGNYWAARRKPLPEEVKLLQALADSTSVAMENVQLYAGLERKVADRTARLQALNEELEAFSYSVSHDLRAPLRHIDAYTQILQEEAAGTLSDESQRHLTVINGAARKMGSLIDDLLTFSRMGRSELKHGRVNMNTLVEEVRREMERETKGRVIKWDVADLPEIKGDRAMLKQVWVNLLSNAVKYTRGRARAEIRIGGRPQETEAEFFVQDNGAGFDMQYADKLFGVFQRLHGDGEFEGTGIGLANVRRIVARHGGRTWADGEVDRGATFHFALPVSPAT
ncbi:MAG TPA: ATP-binding protein [Candidatus Angelobacter sp.]|nr:ATP-binding protein [Candidatus Angelobacter sp.]